MRAKVGYGTRAVARAVTRAVARAVTRAVTRAVARAVTRAVTRAVARAVTRARTGTGVIISGLTSSTLYRNTLNYDILPETEVHRCSSMGLPTWKGWSVMNAAASW